MTWRRRTGLFAAAALGVVLAAGCDGTAVTDEVAPRTGRGATLSTSLLAEESAAEIGAAFAALGLPLSARYDVSVYKILYETVDPHDRVTTASGALFMPKGAPGERPLLSYQHGTLTAREDAPSAGGPEQAVGLALAADGYVAVLPDLLGLGDSPGLHPYVHARSSATAVVDMPRAAHDFAARNGVALNGQLFLMGYSQGGYTAMAAHREIEAVHRDEFEVTASAPMAGAYDLSGVMAETFLAEQPHPEPLFLPYALLAYNAVYGLYDTPSAFLAAPYDTLLPPLFDGRHRSDEIDAAMPRIPARVLRPDFAEAFRTDPNHPVRVRLRENDLYEWTPRAPMRLYHCGQDRHVPPENAQVAVQRFQARGATQVEWIDPLPGGNHATCAAPSLLLAKLWFDGLVR